MTASGKIKKISVTYFADLVHIVVVGTSLRIQPPLRAPAAFGGEKRLERGEAAVFAG